MKTRAPSVRTPGKSSGSKSFRGDGAAAGSAQSRRKFVVFLSLVGLLTGTSALLRLAPAPLSPGSAGSLFAIEQPTSMDVIFNTNVPVAGGRWQYIYVHHSQTASGNASTLGSRAGGLADHFVIGNGAGSVDGEVQIGHRWTAQLPPDRFTARAGSAPTASASASSATSIAPPPPLCSGCGWRNS